MRGKQKLQNQNLFPQVEFEPTRFRSVVASLADFATYDLLTVKVSHLCTTNFMNYIPIFLKLLRELPQVVEKVPLETSRHPTCIDKKKRGVFRTSQVRLPSEYESRITATCNL